jgi:metal-responsive CopG/Arc/MetJ family transcriptional regulator
MEHIMAEFASCMKRGETPNSVEAQGLVKRLQSHITENYYNCTNEILAGLGQMYVADERFKSNIDKHADGTAAFICEAIKIYCCA